MNTILITGANRGIGLELTQQYLADGWRVLACCRQPDQAEQLQKLMAKQPDRLTLLQLDVTDANNLKQLSEQLQTEKIDILINNAGVIGSHTEKFGHLEANAWLETFKTNSVAPCMVTQALINQVMQSERKLIVNISSLLGSIADNTDGGYYYYRASKAALNSVTKSLAVEFKQKAITVISMHPGWVMTDMGGKNAPLQPKESVAGIRKVLNSLTLQDSGSFLSFEGNKLHW